MVGDADGGHMDGLHTPGRHLGAGNSEEAAQATQYNAPLSIAWLYGPIAAGAFFVLIGFIKNGLILASPAILIVFIIAKSTKQADFVLKLLEKTFLEHKTGRFCALKKTKRATILFWAFSHLHLCDYLT